MEGISEAAAVDRISDMPDCILHNILGYCNLKEIGQTSVLSKRWCDVYLSYPRFYQDGVMCNSILESDEVRLESYPKELEKFNKFINFKLNGLQDKKLPLKNIQLSLDLVDECDWVLSWLDAWVDSALKCKVEKLHLNISSEDDVFYKLPESVYSAETITDLQLGFIVFKCESIGFHSLRRFVLRDVNIDEDTIRVLNLSCPLIEYLRLTNCVGFKEVKILGLRMLKIFHFESDKVYKVFIDAPHLEVLGYSYGKVLTRETPFPYETYPILYSRSKYLRRVALRGAYVSNKSLRNILSSSCLDYLFLSKCFMLDEIMMSSISLRDVTIIMCENFVEAILDTPNLSSFRYEGNLMPQLSSMNGFGGWVANIQCLSPLNADWFLNFARFIGVPNKFQVDLSFDDLSSSSLLHSIPMEELQLICPNRSHRVFRLYWVGCFAISIPESYTLKSQRNGKMR